MKLCLSQPQSRSASPPPYFSATFEGTSGEFTIPYSGYYKLTLSGAQGGCYGGEGGRGTTLSKTLWLKDGVTVKYETHISPGTYTRSGSTLTIRGGEPSKLWFDGNLYAQAGGGQGAVNSSIAPSGVTSAVWYSGNNTSSKRSGVHWHNGNTNASATFPARYSTSTPTGCYRWAGHTHDATGACPKIHSHESACYSKCGCTSGNSGNGAGSPCSVCGHNGGHSNPCTHRELDHCTGSLNTYNCGSYANTWTIQCGYSHGQILNRDACSVGASVDNWNCDSSSQTNTGAGKFTIQLIEQNRLDYADTNVKSPMYQNVPLHLVVMEYLDGEHYVAYCKHGN